MRDYQSAEINELATALAKAQGEMKHAKKAAENPAFKREGSVSLYADLPAVIDAAKPHLAANGLSVTQFTDIDDQGKVVLMTQLNHCSGQWIRGYYPLNPVKTDPQGLGSCFTYGRRYTYGGITGTAAADEDDDGNAASGKEGLEGKEKPESIFDSPELRDKFTENSIESIGKCFSCEELKTIKELDLAKWNAMKASPYDGDVGAYNRILAAYNPKFMTLKEAAKDQPKTVESAVKKAGIAHDSIPY